MILFLMLLLTAAPKTPPPYCALLDSDTAPSIPVHQPRITVPTKILSIVTITNECDLRCTGWVIGKDLFITAAHCVVPEMIDVRAVFLDGTSVKLKLLHRGGPPAGGLDIAVLSGDSHGAAPILIRAECRIDQPRSYISIGYGHDGKQKATACVGSRPGPDGLHFYAGDIEEGDSGGPVLDRDGVAAGMQVAYLVQFRRIFAVVPDCTLREFIDESR